MRVREREREREKGLEEEGRRECESGGRVRQTDLNVCNVTGALECLNV